MGMVTLSSPGAKKASTPGAVEPINTTVSVPSTSISLLTMRTAFTTAPFLVSAGKVTGTGALKSPAEGMKRYTPRHILCLADHVTIK